MLSLIAAASLFVAQGTTTCPLYDDIATLIVDNFGELPATAPVSDDDGLTLQLFGAPDGSTWTAVQIDGEHACIVATEKDFFGLRQPGMPT
ncbi:hypothetical protein [Azospirillum halopraeferens]|uniref:hypothetical protein n=1 Tax=Azospirillum halopraeferens TaxID=34010 RepID=UPI00041E10AF|nr:hypothetical protein [Azospirillum halopraeferens]